MKNTMSLGALFLCLASVTLPACGSASEAGGEPSSSSVSEAVTSTFMYVRTDTLPPSPPKAVLSEDPNRPTPSLTQVTVYNTATTTDSGYYSTLADQAILIITPAEWTNMAHLLSDATHQVQVGIFYNESASGTTKPLVGSPTFTLVDRLP